MTTTTTLPAWAQSGTDLNGLTVLVIGGSGGVGEGIVRSALDAGATVIAAGRNAATLSELTTRITNPQLRTEVIDALAPDLDAVAARLAATHGALHGVVTSVASWGKQGKKPALSLTDAEWQELLDSNVTAIFRLYRAFVPHIAKDGVLLEINGMSADLPFPGGAGVALSAAASKSLTRTIAAELDGEGPRVHELILGFVRTRARQLAGIDDPNWIPATDVGVHVAEVLAANSPLTGTVLHYFVDVASGPQPGA